MARAIGRTPKAEEIRNIEDGIRDAVRSVRQKDARDGVQRPDADVFREAAELAAKRAVHQIYKRRQRVAQDAIARAQVMNTLRQHVPEKELTPDYLAQMIAMGRIKGTKNIGVTSAEELSVGALQDWTRQIGTKIDAANNGARDVYQRLTAMDRSVLKDPTYNQLRKSYEYMLVKEMHGQSSGNADVSTLAKALQDVQETSRVARNDVGADIAKLENRGFANYDSRELITRAGRDEWLKTLSVADRAKAMLMRTDPPREWARDAWVKDAMPTYERFIGDDGKPLNDAEWKAALEDVFETKVSDGANKLEPGARGFGGGVKSRGANAPRVLHFTDPQTHWNYLQKYSDKSVMEVILDELTMASRDFGILKTFGPSAEQNFQYALDTIQQHAVSTSGGAKSVDDISAQANKMRKLFDYQSGIRNQASFSPLMQAARNLMTSAMLGSSVITAGATDPFIMNARASALKLDTVTPGVQTVKNLFGKQTKQAIEQLGLVTDVQAALVSRMGGFDTSKGVTGWLAEKNLKLSGMIALDRAHKASFGMSMLHTIGNLTRKFDSLDALKKSDYQLLADKGWTDTDWQIMRAAKLDDITERHQGMTPEAIYNVPDDAVKAAVKPQIDALQSGVNDAIKAMGDLTPEREKKIRQAYADEIATGTARIIRNAKSDAAYKLLGVTHSEMMSAVTTASAIDKFESASSGEIYKSYMLFKTTPFAGVRNFIHTANDLDRMPGLKFAARYIAGTTIGGAVALQLNSLLSGGDPADMTKPGFWISALLKGGSFGIYGDLVLSDQTRYGSSIAGAIGGPALSFGESLYKTTLGNAQKAIQGKDTTFAADSINTARMIAPFASLWYTKAVFNHLILQQMQEMASPGYNAKMEQRMQQNYNQTYWWRPGQAAPSDSPDWQKALGN
ncbi:MAG: hypothetical protein QM578_12420 [Pantoea sp.]|uniref:hypothetical protein n=1 Tax=Pantoea sp. TaxID=69393 RepID=UPI0039E4F4D1